MMKNLVTAIENVINKGGELVICRSNNTESSMETLVPTDIEEENDSIYLTTTNGTYRFYICSVEYDEVHNEYFYNKNGSEVTFCVTSGV